MWYNIGVKKNGNSHDEEKWKNMFDEKEYMKQWRKDNQERIKAYEQQYALVHKKEKAAYDKQRRLRLHSFRKIYMKQYWQTIAGKESKRKSRAIRKGLGYIPLNPPFEGCEAHHISENFVIHIPKELHRCIQHSIWTWQGMEEMNKLAIEWL